MEQPMIKPLPFLPETLPLMRARYNEAIWPLYNVERVRWQNLDAPGQDRKHVFDLKIGIRMIISREWAPLNPPEDRGPYLHLSASLDPAHYRANGSQVPIGEIVKAFLYISRSSNKIVPLWSDISGQGVLHLLFPPPFEGEYAPDVPLQLIEEHESHILKSVFEEDIPPADEPYDPRLHCSLCSTK